MEIDVINYTAEQMATLSNEQLLEVRKAQEEKDKMTMELEENLLKADTDTAAKGIYKSSVREYLRKKIQAKYDAELERLRDGLLFYLRYSYRPGTGQAPYLVDYSLSDVERMEIVRTYYMETYTDPYARLQAFKEDKVAMQYVVEYYEPLYQYFVDATKV